jgi:peptidoglycan/xylan/chitin deacetylase (PgdA/CDA1 family)
MMFMTVACRRFNRQVKRIANTHYPGFIFGLPLNRRHIPVFLYHDVQAEAFAADLAFLRDNGYRTLSTDEFVHLVDRPVGDRCVLLTFDDARRNFWEVAFPLLREFEAHATLFAPTYWMGQPHPTGNPEAALPPGQNRFMTWDQLRLCAQSGLVDVQSHAHRHTLVYTSRRLVGFVSPQLLHHYDIYEWPMRHEGDKALLGSPPLGTPIYEATPLLSAPGCLLEDQAVADACRNRVAVSGGEAFFTRRGWEAELRQLHHERSQAATAPTWMAEDAFASLVASEFQLSLQCFEAELGRPPRYLAYPWRLGSARSLQQAVEAGIRVVFGVGLDVRKARRLTGPLPAYGRFKSDWLRFLPGQGRKQLRHVVPEKIKMLIQTEHFAH